MAVDLNTMATNIQTVLAGVPGIAQAFDHEPQQLPILPAATIYFDGFSENEETIGKLQYDWKWTIRVYIALNQSDVGPPQLQLRTITQNTLMQLRKNLTLLNSCLFSSASSGDVYTILNATNPMLVVEFTLIATTQESR